ncbi:hypothetical protein AF332_27160 [Sporosarcina globispora]|uniref:Uncharacterized protein n=1 Tax=Sporosarcina globispora TaxID=1459 RepID=A0A0M0GL07_SPOGL|nr:hypothetical protein AF332_27160 [Sporosarcina globispora]
MPGAEINVQTLYPKNNILCEKSLNNKAAAFVFAASNVKRNDKFRKEMQVLGGGNKMKNLIDSFLEDEISYQEYYDGIYELCICKNPSSIKLLPLVE